MSSASLPPPEFETLLLKTLVVENDQLTAELLETVALGLGHGATVALTRSFEEAKVRIRHDAFDLVIVDSDLPDGTGADLSRLIRKNYYQVPIVMISTHSDRQSVRAAAISGIDEYISKPFSVKLLHDRIKKLINSQVAKAPVQDIDEFLGESLNRVGQLHTDIDPASILRLIENQDGLTPSKLADLWRDDVSLTARLLDVANSSSFKRSGEPVKQLRDAISGLGVALALNHALALSIDTSNQMYDQAVGLLAKNYIKKSVDVGTAARTLALRLNKPAPLYHQAGLLSRVGELAVLIVIDQYLESGGQLDTAEIESLVSKWAPEYGNHIKVQWKLPLDLRDLIGAVHLLRQGTVKRGLFVMRAAALIADGEEDGADCKALLRRVGLINAEPGVP